MSEKKQITKKPVAKTGAIGAGKGQARASVMAPAKAAAKPVAARAAATSPAVKSASIKKPGVAVRVTAKSGRPASKIAQAVIRKPTAPAGRLTTPAGKATALERKSPAAKLKAMGSNSRASPPPAPKKKLAARNKGRAIRLAKFCVGQVVRHRVYPFRGVVFDIDPVFANTDEWLNAIPPGVRPRRDQPFYHLLAESAETEYIAYVSEQNLLPDDTGQPLRHPQITEYFVENDDGTLRAVFLQAH